MFLYIAKRDQFDKLPKILLDAFGKPQFFMMFNLSGSKQLVHADNSHVQYHIEEQGFYLQMPAHEENLLAEFKLRGY